MMWQHKLYKYRQKCLLGVPKSVAEFGGRCKGRSWKLRPQPLDTILRKRVLDTLEDQFFKVIENSVGLRACESHVNHILVFCILSKTEVSGAWAGAGNSCMDDSSITWNGICPNKCAGRLFSSKLRKKEEFILLRILITMTIKVYGRQRDIRNMMATLSKLNLHVIVLYVWRDMKLIDEELKVFVSFFLDRPLPLFPMGVYRRTYFGDLLSSIL